MPAATVSANHVLAEHKGKIEAGNRNLLDETTLVYGDGMPRLFADSYTIPVTSTDDAGDIYRLYKFPSGAYLFNARITATDADTHATPTLAFSLVVTDSADTVKDTLISASTIGQSGGTAAMLDSGFGQFVGDRYLAIKITTGAATGAAMTLGLVVAYTIGVYNYAAGKNPSMIDVAV